MKPNEQPIEKVIKDHDGKILEVHSVFRTIQGEGPFVGQPAVFVRLAGCTLQCPACDTDYTSNRINESFSSILTYVSYLAKGTVDLVVLTGGEPFRQNVIPLINALLNLRYRVQVETNGMVCPDGLPWHDRRFTVVCSPKTLRVNPRMMENSLVVWKYVVRAGEIEEDGLPSSTMLGQRPARPSHRDSLVYIQPLDEKDQHANQKNYEAAVKSCIEHGYRLSIQIQKIIGVE